jgi:hypothetical protein
MAIGTGLASRGLGFTTGLLVCHPTLGGTSTTRVVSQVGGMVTGRLTSTVAMTFRSGGTGGRSGTPGLSRRKCGPFRLRVELAAAQLEVGLSM